MLTSLRFAVALLALGTGCLAADVHPSMGSSGAEPACDQSTCSGCCDRDVCVSGYDDHACGLLGRTCEACSVTSSCGPTRACNSPPRDGGATELPKLDPTEEPYPARPTHCAYFGATRACW